MGDTYSLYLMMLISILVLVVFSYLAIPEGAAHTVMGRSLSRFQAQQVEVLPGKLRLWGVMAQHHDAPAVETMYHLLGACRGVSAGMAGYGQVADGIDWACWREERF